ncbi:MAG: DNA-directed RNA polymerase subunit alpha [Dehalococcoidia bacterium]|nr:DNA-directed RNA polymerase subunit alpha [Dehalococcoidia bacterium]
MLETSIMSRGTTQGGTENLTPEIKILQADNTYGKFTIEPLQRGYGMTIGNPIRRMLLSSIEGTAITWVKIDGVLHEYSNISHMREEVMEFLLRVKGIRIRSVTGRPGKMRLEITGQGRVCAGDIATSADFEIVNPEHHLATLDSDDAAISVEFNVDHGKGYQPVSQGDGITGPLMGVLPVDAIFSPVRKVNYAIERTRVGHVTDYERLVLEMWTDGTITPIDALKKSSDVLVNHFFLFSNLGNETKGGADRPLITVSPEIYQTPIEKLELTPRTLNCLKRAYVSKVGQVLEMSNSELLKIRNFGEKSLEELLTKLGAKGMLSEEDAAARLPGHGTNGGAQEGVGVFQTSSEIGDDSHIAAQFEVEDDKPIWDDRGGDDEEDDLLTLYDAKSDSSFRQNREEN